MVLVSGRTNHDWQRWPELAAATALNEASASFEHARDFSAFTPNKAR